MTEASGGDGWSQAENGRWYPPAKAATDAFASDLDAEVDALVSKVMDDDAAGGQTEPPVSDDRAPWDEPTAEIPVVRVDEETDAASAPEVAAPELAAEVSAPAVAAEASSSAVAADPGTPAPAVFDRVKSPFQAPGSESDPLAAVALPVDSPPGDDLDATGVVVPGLHEPTRIQPPVNTSTPMGWSPDEPDEEESEPVQEVQAASDEGPASGKLRLGPMAILGTLGLLGAGAALIAGAFLIWADGTGEVSGGLDGFDSNGLGTMICGVVLALIAAAALLGLVTSKKTQLLMQILAAAAALVAVGILVFSWLDISDLSDQLEAVVDERNGGDGGVEHGVGFWVSAGGAVLGFLSAWLLRMRGKSKRTATL